MTSRDVHVAPENEHILPPFGSPDSLWMTRSQRSRRRDTCFSNDVLQYQLRPLAVGKQTNSSFLRFFVRPDCPGFSFADVDTYVIILLCLSSSFSFSSGVRCCLQLFHRLICLSFPPSSVSCLLRPVSLL